MRRSEKTAELLRARILGGDRDEVEPDSSADVLPFSFGEKGLGPALVDLIEREVRRRVQREVNRKLAAFRAEVRELLAGIVLGAATRGDREWRQ